MRLHVHMYTVHAHVRDQLKTWTVIRPLDGFEGDQQLGNGPDNFETGVWFCNSS